MHTPQDASDDRRPLSRREAREAREREETVANSSPSDSGLAPVAGSSNDQLRRAYDEMIARGGTPLARSASSDADTRAPRGARTGRETNEEQEPVAKSAKPRKRRRWPWIVFPILGVVLVLIGVGGVFLMQALQVRDDLQAAKSKITAIVPLVKEGETEKIREIADEVLTLTTQANDTVSNPLWEVLGGVPLVGQNVSAVGETTKATHILVSEAMPTALDLLSVIDVKNIKLEGGGFNLQPFRDAEAQLPGLVATFQKAKGHVDTIDRDAILPFVDENIGQLIDILDQAAPAMDMAQTYLPTLLALAGGDGPRDYAILFQNNAEIRATGGNPGAAAILHVDNGKIDMREDEQVLAYAYLGYAGTGMPGLESAEAMLLFEDDTAQYVQNFTRYPDFRDTGSQVSQLWERATDTSLQGVISIDPVFLSYMLSVTGPVTVEGEPEPITAENAVKLLLSDTYERFGTDGPAADAYFAAAASAIFDRVSSGDWDPMAMIDQFQRGISEQRIYLWFPDETTQAMAEELNLAGVVTADNATTTQAGIYLNDASYSKLEYWLSTSVDISCDPNTSTMTTNITLTNNLPDEIQSGYTLGNRNDRLGFERSTMLLDVLSMALPGGSLIEHDPAAGDLDGWDRSGVYNGREALSLFVALPQGETRRVAFTSTIPEDATQPLTVRYTPTTSTTPVTIAPACVALFPGTEVPDQPTP